ncbi:MAG: hypothetical protein JO152_08470 [Mycobacteriaceae bacterium]|nr:hypothetical protein [Mycobacteriaceae bacterium]
MHPENPQRGWTARHTAAAVGVAAVIAAVGGVAVYAATSEHSNGPAWHGPGIPGGPGFQPPLHGESVVSDGNGGYLTELTQTGTVSAVSDSSLTVQSADGFSQTYTRAGADPQVAVNDTVTVRGTLTNGTATATAISEGTDGGPGFGAPPHRQRPN